MNNLYKIAAQKIAEAKSILALTGAGISADSGIPTFRSNGVWKGVRSEEVASIDFLLEQPETAWEWYDSLRGLMAKNKPNAGHEALAKLEKLRGNFTLATQNIDRYHSDAGSLDVLELHGNMWRLRCMDCGANNEDRRIDMKPLPPRCSCGGMLRPDIVLYGEQLPEKTLLRAMEAARVCDLCLVIGTSGIVYPAAMLPELAKRAGAFIIEINPEATAVSSYADLRIPQGAAKALPEVLRETEKILKK